MDWEKIPEEQPKNKQNFDQKSAKKNNKKEDQLKKEKKILAFIFPSSTSYEERKQNFEEIVEKTYFGNKETENYSHSSPYFLVRVAREYNKMEYEKKQVFKKMVLREIKEIEENIFTPEDIERLSKEATKKQHIEDAKNSQEQERKRYFGEDSDENFGDET